jgi:hypothetical protein
MTKSPFAVSPLSGRASGRAERRPFWRGPLKVVTDAVASDAVLALRCMADVSGQALRSLGLGSSPIGGVGSPDRCSDSAA